MKIITKAFFDGHFITQEERSKYYNRFPSPQEIEDKIDQLRNSNSSAWGHLVLITENGVSSTSITENDLTIDY